MKLIATLVLLVSLAVVGYAQRTFVGAGASVNHSTSKVPDGDTFAGIYLEGALELPKSLQARLLVDFNNEATLPTIFTRDNNQVFKVAESEIRFRPELRYHFRKFGDLEPFVQAGVDAYKQSFDRESEGFEFGLNPTIGAGAKYYGHEASYNRLLKDRTTFNRSGLSGNRVSYSYTHKLSSAFGVKIGAELDAVSFTEAASARSRDYYREYDVIFKARVGFIYGK